MTTVPGCHNDNSFFISLPRLLHIHRNCIIFLFVNRGRLAYREMYAQAGRVRYQGVIPGGTTVPGCHNNNSFFINLPMCHTI